MTKPVRTLLSILIILHPLIVSWAAGSWWYLLLYCAVPFIFYGWFFIDGHADRAEEIADHERG